MAKLEINRPTPSENIARNRIGIGKKSMLGVRGMLKTSIIMIKGTRDKSRFTRPVPTADTPNTVLGIYIQENLIWERHISNQSAKMSRTVSVM